MFNSDHAEAILDGISGDSLVCMFAGGQNKAELTASNNELCRRIFSHASILQFGGKIITMHSSETGNYREDALLLYSHRERRDDFITFLRSACLVCGLDDLLLVENCQAYKLYPSGEMDRVGDCAATVADLERYYSAWRGASLCCCTIMDRHYYREGPQCYASAVGYAAACKDLKRYSVNY